MRMNQILEGYGRRPDAYQRDYDHSVAGMDRGNNHRDDERHDLDPSDWYIVKDGKMYKTSVYPRQEQEAMSRGYSRTRDEAKAKASEQGVAEGSEWETRHDEFVTVGDRATPEQINKIVSALGVAAKQASSKRGFLNQIVGKQSNGDLARMAHGAETLAKNIQRNRNAKLGTDERKELGQQLVYAVSLLKRMNGEQGVAEGSSTTWEVSYDYGPHMTKSVTVNAGSEEEARAKVEKAAEKKGLSIMINSVEPAQQGVAEEQVDELSKDTLKSYVPKRIEKTKGLAKTDYDKAHRIIKKDIPRAMSKYKDPNYGKAQPTSPVDENKKGVRAVKHTTKPRNFVAKNAVQSGAGAHKDKKKAQKQGDTKHKNKEPAYESRLWAALDRRIIK